MTPPPGQRQDEAASLHDVLDVYRQHERSVHRLCMRYLGDAEAAADATQETFLRAAAAVHTAQPEMLKAYLFGIARNVCRHELRRRQRGGGTTTSGVRPEADDPEALAVEAVLVNHVWRRLSVRDRMLLLHRFAGYSYEEMAERLHLSVKAVDVALTRARQRARRLLDGLAATVWAMRPKRRGRHRWDGGARLRSLGVARRFAAWKLALAVAVVAASGLNAAPALWRMAGAVPAAGAALESSDLTSAVGGGSGDPLLGIEVSDLALSPTYDRDRTILASGRRVDCPTTCPVLLRSGDGGRRWEALPARGFAGGTLLLAPSRGGGAVILAAGPRGLQRSDDGGRSFRTAAAAPGPAAISPRSRSGDALVAAGTERIVLYRTRDGSTVPGPALPARARATAIAFTADGGHLLVAVTESRPAEAEQDSLLRCGLGAGACRRVLSAAPGTLHLLSAPPAAGSTTVAFSPQGLQVMSADGAAVTAARSLASDELVTLAAGARGGGALLTAVLRRAGGSGVVAVSADLGRSFAVSGSGAAVPPGATALLATPDGRILVAVSGAGASRDDGLRCSLDGGATWRLRC